MRTEGMDEMKHIFVTNHSRCDLDWNILIVQQRRGAFDSAARDESLWRMTRGLFDQPAQMHIGQIQSRCLLLKIPVAFGAVTNCAEQILQLIADGWLLFLSLDGMETQHDSLKQMHCFGLIRCW